MATQIQFRRGTATQHNSFTGATAEVTVNTTNKSLHVHDGTTAGGFELAKADLSNTSSLSLSGLTTISSLKVSNDLYVSGVSTFVGAVTFQGGTITLGDANTDNVVFTADVNSNIIPNTDATYDLGNGSQRWKNAIFSGVVTATTFVGALTGTATTASSVSLDSVGLGTHTYGDYVKNITGTSNQITVTSGTGESSTPTLSIPNQFTAPQDVTVTRDLQVNRNLNINGNITIGGTAATLFTTEFKVYDPDIVLGFRTDGSGNDNSTDNTANHGGVAIASTEGNPLIQLYSVGLGETNPSTYKKFMWFKSGSFSGLGTDAWVSNYAISIGNTSSVKNNSRLTVGAGFTVYDTYIDAQNIKATSVNSTGIVTATDFNSTSDINLKENIRPIQNSTEIISGLEGVRFVWKADGKESIGVIAQEIEKTLPELVSGGDIKTVNYNGLIGVLIEVVKDQQKQIDNLRTEIENLKEK